MICFCTQIQIGYCKRSVLPTNTLSGHIFQYWSQFPPSLFLCILLASVCGCGDMHSLETQTPQMMDLSGETSSLEKTPLKLSVSSYRAWSSRCCLVNCSSSSLLCIHLCFQICSMHRSLFSHLAPIKCLYYIYCTHRVFTALSIKPFYDHLFGISPRLKAKLTKHKVNGRKTLHFTEHKCVLIPELWDSGMSIIH